MAPSGSAYSREDSSDPRNTILQSIERLQAQFEVPYKTLQWDVETKKFARREDPDWHPDARAEFVVETRRLYEVAVETMLGASANRGCNGQYVTAGKLAPEMLASIKAAAKDFLLQELDTNPVFRDFIAAQQLDTARGSGLTDTTKPLPEQSTAANTPHSLSVDCTQGHEVSEPSAKTTTKDNNWPALSKSEPGSAYYVVVSMPEDVWEDLSPTSKRRAVATSVVPQQDNRQSPPHNMQPQPLLYGMPPQQPAVSGAYPRQRSRRIPLQTMQPLLPVYAMPPQQPVSQFQAQGFQ